MLRISTGFRNRIMGKDLNLITNGAFTSTTDNWTATNAVLASIAGGQSGNCLEITTNSVNVAKAYQDITCKIGHYYLVSVYGKNVDASGGKVMVGTTADEDAIFDSLNMTQAAAWVVFFPNQGGSYSAAIVFQATATTHRITLQNSDTTNTGKKFLFDTVAVSSLAKSVKDVFHLGFLKIFAGSQLASADYAESGMGNLLVTISDASGGNGLQFDEAASGTLSKKASQTWSGTVTGTGTQTAYSFRLIQPGDLATQNENDCRIDGAVGTAAQELNMSSTALANGATVAISTFALTMPSE